VVSTVSPIGWLVIRVAAPVSVRIGATAPSTESNRIDTPATS
jgi:hypothetical protein